ncbi:hypothetical protein BC940DRAFT_319581 [Gongronella butleri]|nr:hypothetical protein BC940DRAFT_319581 [Gongronella butleri]
MCNFPDELLTCIFEHVPVNDLKMVRLCQRRWSVLSSRILFKKTTFCLAQPSEKQAEQFDFLMTPLTCSENATPGQLARNLLVHHQHLAGPLALLPRLNAPMPSITHLDIDACKCYKTRNYVLDDIPSSVTNELWHAAAKQWLSLQSIAIRTLQIGMGGSRVPVASALVTHLNLGTMRLRFNNFFELPSMFPCLHFLSCKIDTQDSDDPTVFMETNFMLNHLRKIRPHYETGELVSRGQAWASLSTLEWYMYMSPLDECYLLLALAMVAPNLTDLTYKLYAARDAFGPFDVPAEALNACVLSNGHLPSFKVLQSVEIEGACINDLMASALFGTTQSLMKCHIRGLHTKPRDGDNEFRDDLAICALVRHYLHLSGTSTLRDVAFSSCHALNGSQLLVSMSELAFANVVTLALGLGVEKNAWTRGAPVVKYPARRVPHNLKDLFVTVLFRQNLTAPKNIENINPGIIRYSFDYAFKFDLTTMAPNEDDALFMWLGPDAQKMAMDVHNWANAPETDVRLSWMGFSCHMASLTLKRPTLHLEGASTFEQFGVVVIYQAAPGPGDPKLRIYYVDGSDRKEMLLDNELDLVSRLEAVRPVVSKRLKERRTQFLPGQSEHVHGIPSTTTVLIVLAKKIDNLEVVGLY